MLKTGNIKFVADLIAIAVFVFFVGSLIGAWSYYEIPHGGDAFNQLQKVRWILDTWPHLTWTNQWAGGMPLMRWYPPVLYYIVATVVVLSKLSIELAMVSVIYVLYFVGAASTYALMLKLTGSRGAAVLTVILVMISPSIWEEFVVAGVYGRVGALMMLPAALWLAVELIEHRQSARQIWGAFSALVIVLALSVLFNPLLGVPTMALTILLIIFSMEGWTEKLKLILKLAVSVFFIAAFFLFPFLLRNLPDFVSYSWGSGPTMDFLVFSRFPAPESYAALSPIVVSFVIIVLLLSRLTKARLDSIPQRKTLKFLALVTVFAIMLIGAALLSSTVVGYAALALAILPFTLGSLGGIIYHGVVASATKFSKYASVLVIIGLICSMLFVSGVPITRAFGSTVVPDDSIRILRELHLDKNQTFQYRVGLRGTEGLMGQWWNYRSSIPQTRDYYGIGVLYPDWIAWLNDAVWKSNNNYEEMNFLLDWWSIKWILVNNVTSDPSKFLSSPDTYRLAANVSDLPIYKLYEFEYNVPYPILYATNAPTLLVIAGDQYRTVINDLSFSGSSDSRLIPIHGGAYIDDYSIDDLRNFDAVLIYGYNYHDRARAWDLLSQYVNSGGGLVIDTGFSPDSNSETMPLPSPVDSTHWTNFGTEWQFSWVKSDQTDDINFSSFAPAVSAGGGWGVSASYNSSVRDWAKPVVWDAGQPLMVAGRLGQGRVFWTGMNLLYHIGTYKNYEEARLLANAITWACGLSQPIQNVADYASRQDNPERDTVVLNSESHGVLFKEFSYVDWNAGIDTANGVHETLPIYQAGPDFMYVGIPKGITFPATVTFEFD